MSIDLRRGCKQNSYVFEGARNKNVTNSYVEAEGVFMNLTPIVLWKDMVLKSISASSDGVETWIAEIHDNGTPIVGATLSVIASSESTRDDLNIALPKGTKLMFYVNGSKIKKSRIVIEAL